MAQLQIREKHLDTFKLIISAYQDITIVPEAGRWIKFNNNELWTRHIVQIIVVGSSAGADRFYSNPEFSKMVNFDALKNSSDAERVQNVNTALRKAKVRYASKDLKKCMKTKAIVHNFRFINSYADAFTGIIQLFSSFTGDNAEMDRVNFFRENLKFMKNKSARDFLMGIGMNRNTLAIDIRIQNIFNHLGMNFPTSQELGKEKIYAETEKKIIQKICVPLKIEPIVFDRILYQNADKIVKDAYLIPRLF